MAVGARTRISAARGSSEGAVQLLTPGLEDSSKFLPSFARHTGSLATKGCHGVTRRRGWNETHRGLPVLMLRSARPAVPFLAGSSSPLFRSTQ